jgi:hypothetical protein
VSANERTIRFFVSSQHSSDNRVIVSLHSGH